MPRAASLLSLLVAACTSTTSSQSPQPAQQPEAPTPAPTTAAGDAWLVGVLGQTGNLECLRGAEERWVDVVPTIGATRIAVPDLDEALYDRPVVARGTIDAQAPERASALSPEAEPCPPKQMRSDWIETPRGLRIDRGGPQPLPHFTVAELRPLAELAMQTQGETITVDLRNPVPVELRDVQLRMHYEGCHGKPGTAVETHPVGTLAVGAGTRASFPAIVQSERAPGRLEPHRAFSLQVIAAGEQVHVDLDAHLADVGVTVKCPGD